MGPRVRSLAGLRQARPCRCAQAKAAALQTQTRPRAHGAVGRSPPASQDRSAATASRLLRTSREPREGWGPSQAAGPLAGAGLALRGERMNLLARTPHGGAAW